MIKIELPFELSDIKRVSAGDVVYLNGDIYTARDQAHARLAALAEKRKQLPVDLAVAPIYYCGPTPEAPGNVIGSCGPTTSSRMDPFTPYLMEQGLKVMIGKGGRNEAVRTSIKKHKGLYLLTYGGCGALLHECVRERELIAFDDLGPEAIYRLKVEDFPVVVAIDSKGKSIWD